MKRRGNILASLVRDVELARTDALIVRCLAGGGVSDADIASVEAALRTAEARAAVPRKVA